LRKSLLSRRSFEPTTVGTPPATGSGVDRDAPQAANESKTQNRKQTTMTTMTESTTINSINIDALRGAIDAITQEPAHGMAHWEVTSHWLGGTLSDARVASCHIGGQRVPKDFTIGIDEPLELCGANQSANLQEYLLAALNGCMSIGYSACCALEGIELDELRIETEGDIDLRGFQGIDPTVRPGYDQLRYTVHVKGSGTPEQFEKVHRTVMATSPNYFNLANAIPLKARLVVE
jgi:uncharacterized OsmC-like protein